jgi:hypothetical protein
VIDAGAPAVFVRLKLAVAVTPETVAITVYDPAVVFAVNAGEVATPLELVVAVVVFVAPANVPLAPVAGAVNVTATPLTGDVPFITVTCRFLLNAVPTVALCGVVPAVAVIEMVGAGAELEPQPIQKAKAKKTKARILA